MEIRFFIVLCLCSSLIPNHVGLILEDRIILTVIFFPPPVKFLILYGFESVDISEMQEKMCRQMHGLMTS